MKALKIIGIVLGVLILILIGIGVFVATNTNTLVKDAIETFGPEYLGVPVTVSEVDISWTEGTGTLRGLEIANPEGYAGPYAMRLDEIRVALDAAESSQELLVLNEVLIDGADVAAEVKGVSTTTNLQVLMDNLEAAMGPEDPADTSTTELIVDRLDMVGAHASAASDIAGSAAVDIPDVHLTDVGRASNGATMAEVVRQVLEPVTRAVTRAVVEQGIGREQIEQRLEDEVSERLPEGLEDLNPFDRSDEQ